MTLDEAIDLEKSLIGKGENYDWVAEHLHEWLTELRDRRESELRPATKFLGNSIHEQMSHLLSEFDEVMVEYGWTITNEQRFAEELIDLQMSCETMLAILDLNEQQRNEARRKVIAKNTERGYYKETL